MEIENENFAFTGSKWKPTDSENFQPFLQGVYLMAAIVLVAILSNC